MIVRYEVGYINQQGWYQNVDSFHHLVDAVDAANRIVSASTPRSGLRITEQHFANEEAYISSDGLRRSRVMTLDDATNRANLTIIEIDTNTSNFMDALSEIGRKRRNDIELTPAERVLCDACNV